MSKPGPVLLGCGHFAQGTNPDGSPRCVICGERAAIEQMKDRQAVLERDAASRPDPTGATATTTAVAAPAIGATEPAPGVYDLPDSVYHADPLRAYGSESLSATSARLLLAPSTPAHYRYAMDHPDAGRSAAMIFGKAVHAVTLGTGQLVVFDGASWNSKAGEQFLAEHPDHGDEVPILARDVPAATAMARALREHPIASLGLTGTPEQAMFVKHPATRVWMRGKVDVLTPARDGRLIITDVKTTQCADASEFSRSAGKFGYHRQADWYGWQARLLGIARDVTVIFAAVETTPPYLVAVHEIDTGDLRRARALNEAALARFADCLATGRWPGYPQRINRITIPGWIARDEEDALTGADEGENQ
jgi:hypothetical protein